MTAPAVLAATLDGAQIGRAQIGRAQIGRAQISVRGNASAEELAVVLAVVSSAPRPPDGYRRWRATRLAALRRPPAGLDDRG